MNRIYLETARLLTQVSPLIFSDDTFALKGGTAINLFVRDMPRLSVDLDLVFPDHRLERELALDRIHGAIREAADRLKKKGFQTYTVAAPDAGETKLLVRRGGVEVKVEVNFVMRGTVYPVRIGWLPGSASLKICRERWMPTSAHSFCLWSAVRRNGICWTSVISRTFPESAGSFGTWNSSRSAARPNSLHSEKHLPSAWQNCEGIVAIRVDANGFALG